MPRKIAAILNADVAGYCGLTGEDEEGTVPNPEINRIYEQSPMLNAAAASLTPLRTADHSVPSIVTSRSA